MKSSPGKKLRGEKTIRSITIYYRLNPFFHKISATNKNNGHENTCNFLTDFSVHSLTGGDHSFSHFGIFFH